MTLSLSIKVPDAQTDELVTKYSAIKDFSFKVERARAVAREFFNTDKLELNADKVKQQNDLQSDFNTQFSLLESLLKEKLIAKLEKELESPTSAVSRDETKEESVQAEDKAAKAETAEPAETAEEETKTAPAENVNDDKVELVTDSLNNTNVEKLQQAKATSEEKSEEVAPSENKEDSKETKASDKKEESAPIPERANLYAKNLLNIAEQRSITLLRELSQNPRKFMSNSKLLGLNDQVFHDAACARYYQLMADPKSNPSVTDRQIMSWAVGPLGYNGCLPLLNPVVQKLSNNYAVEAFREALICFDKCRQNITQEKYHEIRAAVKKYADKITEQDRIIILSFINEEIIKRYPALQKVKSTDEAPSELGMNTSILSADVVKAKSAADAQKKEAVKVPEVTEDDLDNPDNLPF